MKEINGCDRDSTLGERWIIGTYKLKRCPLKEITPEGLEYLEAYKFYKNGVLPVMGGWMNQSNTFIEAIRIIESESLRVEKEMQKAQKR
jgi:hypothetical protein